MNIQDFKKEFSDILYSTNNAVTAMEFMYKSRISLRKPIEPYAGKIGSVGEAKAFTKKWEDYDKELNLYHKTFDEKNEFNNKIYAYAWNTVKEFFGFNNIPEKYHQKIMSKVHDVSGINDQMIELEELCDIFNV